MIHKAVLAKMQELSLLLDLNRMLLNGLISNTLRVSRPSPTVVGRSIQGTGVEGTYWTVIAVTSRIKCF